MAYKINELARLSGVSPRTLRYYDQIGLLCPGRQDENGYRLYEAEHVDRLQQILFYRALGMPLEEIEAVLSAPDFDRSAALEAHLSALQEKKQQLEAMIDTVTRTIRAEKEGILMTDSEKFEGFKKQQLDENEKTYGAEIRARYGEAAVEATNGKFRAMSADEWGNTEELTADLNQTLGKAFAAGDPASPLAQRACELHRQWLCRFWTDGMYSKEAHLALAEGYVADERFTAYYDKLGKGCTVFLRDALKIYCRS